MLSIEPFMLAYSTALCDSRRLRERLGILAPVNSSSTKFGEMLENSRRKIQLVVYGGDGIQQRSFVAVVS